MDTALPCQHDSEGVVVKGEQSKHATVTVTSELPQETMLAPLLSLHSLYQRIVIISQINTKTFCRKLSSAPHNQIQKWDKIILQDDRHE